MADAPRMNQENRTVLYADYIVPGRLSPMLPVTDSGILNLLYITVHIVPDRSVSRWKIKRRELWFCCSGRWKGTSKKKRKEKKEKRKKGSATGLLGVSTLGARRKWKGMLRERFQPVVNDTRWYAAFVTVRCPAWLLLLFSILYLSRPRVYAARHR